jgi:hypothetical protein
MSEKTTNTKYTKWYTSNANNAEKVMDELKLKDNNNLPLTPENGKLLFGKAGAMRQLTNATITSRTGGFYSLFRNLLPVYQSMKLEALMDNISQEDGHLKRFKNLAKVWADNLNDIIKCFDNDNELKKRIEEEIAKEHKIGMIGAGVVMGADIGGGIASEGLIIAGAIAGSSLTLATGLGVFAASITIVAIAGITTIVKSYLEKEKTKEKLGFKEKEYNLVMTAYRKLFEATCEIKKFNKLFRSYEIKFEKYGSSISAFIGKCKNEAAKYKALKLKEKKPEKSGFFSKLKEKISNTAKDLSGIKKLDDQKLRFVKFLEKLTIPEELEKIEGIKNQMN